MFGFDELERRIEKVENKVNYPHLYSNPLETDISVLYEDTHNLHNKLDKLAEAMGWRWEENIGGKWVKCGRR